MVEPPHANSQSPSNSRKRVFTPYTSRHRRKRERPGKAARGRSKKAKTADELRHVRDKTLFVVALYGMINNALEQ